MKDEREILQTLRGWLLPLGEKLLSASGKDLDVRHKGRVDLVTRLDEELQATLDRQLSDSFPTDSLVAEEDGLRARSGASAVWYLDPLDGTTNYVHGFPFYCISLARWVEGRPQLGIVYAPALDELFSAIRGSGATLERPRAAIAPAPIRCSGRSQLSNALLATGFPYERASRSRFNLRCCAHALSKSRGLRRGGSAALDLCYVAAGRLDGYWEEGLHPWDVAAGALIVSEAGAVLSDYDGQPDILSGERIVASTPGIHGEILAFLREAMAHPEVDPLASD